MDWFNRWRRPPNPVKIAREAARIMCAYRGHPDSHLQVYCNNECVTEALKWLSAIEEAKRKVRDYE